MAIKHADVMVSGQKGYASEWNADHVVDDDSKPKNSTTLIVAASDSLDTTRADYVCDGIDDNVEMTQAIADLPAAGGRISLLEGTFDNTAAVNINKDNVTIEGQGNSTLVQSLTPGINIFVSTNKEGIIISNLKIDCTSAANRGIYLTTCTKSRVEKCFITDTNFQGILAVTCTDLTIINNHLDQTRSSGITAQSGTRVLINSNTFTDCGAGVNAAAISIPNLLFGSVVNGNLITDCHGGVDTSSISGTNYTVITSNVMYNPSSYGIQLTNNAHNNVISNNTIYSAGDDGIIINGDYNIIANNRVRNSTNDEIHIRGGNKNHIHGNTLIGVHVNAINDGGVGTVANDNLVA